MSANDQDKENGDGGDDEEKEKPTPPVPPQDSTAHPDPDKRRMYRVIEEEYTGDLCDCGGKMVDKTIVVGMVLHLWDYTEWDSDEYKLQAEAPQKQFRVECDRCGIGYDY